MPLLEKALGRSVQLPKRSISSVEELWKLVPEVKDLFIYGTERKTQRPKSGKLKKKRYSGKKKMHSWKNTVVCDEKRKIVLITPTKEGRLHDLSQLKKSGLLDCIPQEIGLWVDKGYTGIQKFVRNGNSIMIPHKKPRGNQLTPEQKQENSVISGIRMTGEHAIGPIKRFASMSSAYRNKRDQDDMMIYLYASLCNFHLQYKNI